MVGQLIEAGGGKMGFGLHRFAQHTGVGHAAVIVYIGVAGIEGNRICAMLVLHCRQLFSNGTEGFFPADFNPAITLLFNRHRSRSGSV